MILIDSINQTQLMLSHEYSMIMLFLSIHFLCAQIWRNAFTNAKHNGSTKLVRRIVLCPDAPAKAIHSEFNSPSRVKCNHLFEPHPLYVLMDTMHTTRDARPLIFQAINPILKALLKKLTAIDLEDNMRPG